MDLSKTKCRQTGKEQVKTRVSFGIDVQIGCVYETEIKDLLHFRYQENPLINL